MTTVLTPSLTELLHRVGDVPIERIVFDPAPGTATIADVQRHCDGGENRYCELVDGVLVEKAMGHWAGLIEAVLIGYLMSYLRQHPLGEITTASSPYRLAEDQVRFPDVAFTSWDRIPVNSNRKSFTPEWTPNLAIEVLSPTNTRGEMPRKLEDYFAAGVELVWYIDPEEQTVEVFTSVDDKRTLTGNETLTAGTVLPGFEISLPDIFDAGRGRRPKP